MRVRVPPQLITIHPHPVLVPHLTPGSPLPPYMVTARLNWGRCSVGVWVCRLGNLPYTSGGNLITILHSINFYLIHNSHSHSPHPSHPTSLPTNKCSRMINTKYLLLLTATDCVGFGLDRDIISLTLPLGREIIL